jgi:chromosome partitioning protein
MKQVIAVCSMKGGVGKTTTAVHVAAALAALPNQSVLLADLDAQGSVGRYFQLERQPLTAFEVLLGECALEDAVQRVRPGLWVLPADERLSALETQVVVKENRQGRLRDNLTLAKRYSYVVVDTPPTPNWAMLNALYAADALLIPVTAERLPVAVLGDYLKLLARTIERESLRARVLPGGVVPTFFESRTKARRAAYEELVGSLGRLVGPPVRASVKVPEAAAAGQTVFEYAPQCQTARDYVALTKEVLKWQRELTASPSPRQVVR